MKAMTIPSRRDQDRLRWGWAGLAPLLLLLLLVDAHTGIALAPSAENRLPAFLGTLCSTPDRHSKAQTGRISRSTPEAYPRAKGARWAAGGGGNDEQSASLFKGLGVLEWANALVPQSALVKGARTSWNLIWKVRGGAGGGGGTWQPLTVGAHVCAGDDGGAGASERGRQLCAAVLRVPGPAGHRRLPTGGGTIPHVCTTT